MLLLSTPFAFGDGFFSLGGDTQRFSWPKGALYRSGCSTVLVMLVLRWLELIWEVASPEWVHVSIAADPAVVLILSLLKFV